MAVDFPSSPLDGQLFTAEGGSWRFKNGVWVALNTEGAAQTIVADGFSPTQASNNWIVWGDVMLQWGRIDTAGAPATATVTFVKAFKVIPNVTISAAGGTELKTTLTAVTATQFTVATFNAAGASATAATHWHAMGEALDVDKMPKSVAGGSGDFSITEADARYLKLTGGTLTEQLRITNSTVGNWSQLIFDRSNDTAANAILFRDSTAKTRWTLTHGGQDNAGLQFSRYDAAGAYQHVPLELRADGNITLTGAVVVAAIGASDYASVRLKRAADATGANAVQFLDANNTVRWQWIHPGVNGNLMLERMNASGVGQGYPIAAYADGTLELTGQVNLKAPDTSTPTKLVFMKSAAAYESALWFLDAGGATRWRWTHLGGANAPIALQMYDAAGTAQVTPITVNSSSGWVTFGGNITAQAIVANTTIAATGVVTGSALSATGQVKAASSVLGDFYMGASSNNPIINYLPNYYDIFAVATGERSWINNSALGMKLQWDGTFTIAGNGYKPGGGTWTATSDERVKNVEDDFTDGLAAVLALRPVFYTYKGNNTPTRDAMIADSDGIMPHAVASAPFPASPNYHVARENTRFVGLVAQEAECALPEIVRKTAGFIDGEAVDDLRVIDTGPLLYALVNAVKELAAEVATLKRGK